MHKWSHDKYSKCEVIYMRATKNKRGKERKRLRVESIKALAQCRRHLAKNGQRMIQARKREEDPLSLLLSMFPVRIIPVA